jgi:hypothetical protein
MQHIKRFENFINELYRHGYTDTDTDLDGKTVVVFGAKIWVLDEDNYDYHIAEIMEEVEYDTDIELYDLHELTVHDPRVFVGKVEGDMLVIPYADVRHTSRSPEVIKTLRELGLSGVRVEYYDEKEDDTRSYEETPPQELKVTDFYHGTCLKYVNDILRLGIAPRRVTRKQSNYSNINHRNKVFTTTNKDTGVSHAFHTASLYDSFPVVVVHSIPDTSLLGMDYDVAVLYHYDNDQTKKMGYLDISKQGHHNTSRSKDIDANITDRVGIYSYQGRIPHSHIKGVMLHTDSLRDYILYERGLYDLEDITLSGDIDEWTFIRASEVAPLIKRLEDELIYDDEEDEDDYYYDDEEDEDDYYYDDEEDEDDYYYDDEEDDEK